MFILQHLLTELKSEFDPSRKGEERGIWFIYTIVAIIIPFTSSKTSNLLRCLIVWFYQYFSQALLYFYGFTQNSMETAVASFVGFNP